MCCIIQCHSSHCKFMSVIGVLTQGGTPSVMRPVLGEVHRLECLV